ncbi:MAG: hypothetical protein AAFY56_19750 [Pseudomonadota bacterium]
MLDEWTVSGHDWLWMMSDLELIALDKALQDQEVRIVIGDSDWYLEVETTDKGDGQAIPKAFVSLDSLAQGQFRSLRSSKAA